MQSGHNTGRAERPYGAGASSFGFEDLEVYKAAREFRRGVYALAKFLPDPERYALAQQMRRAAVSLTSNIAEGYGRHHRQEGLQFCRQARGSLMELVDALNTCLDEGYGKVDHLEGMRARAGDVLRLLNGYIAYLSRQKLKDNGE